MAVIEDLQQWRTKRWPAAERLAAARSSDELLAALNFVKITGPQMRAAIDTISHIQMHDRDDALRHSALLVEFAEREQIDPKVDAGPALHARAIAMDRWCHRHDPLGKTDIDAFFEAGAKAPVIVTGGEIGFDPETFRELVEFIRELPF